MKAYTTNIYKLEIDITFNCSLRCLNCDRGLSIINHSKNTDMQIEQITKFISESINCNHLWERIRIMGGEPTLHPDFESIINLFADYKEKYNKEVELIVSTNGFSKITISKIEWVKKNYPNIIIENSNKKGNEQKDFHLIHMAPSDIHRGDDSEYNYLGCWATEACAISLNYSGFYCCAVAGMIARVFNYDIGIKSVEKLSINEFEKTFNQVCSKCGRYHEIKVDNSNIMMIMSETWENAVINYNENILLSKY